MSLQYLTELQRGIDLDLKIGCTSLKTDTIEATTYIGLPNNGTMTTGTIDTVNYSMGSGTATF